MQFIPSQQSYGYSEDSVEAPPPARQGPDAAQVGQYVDIGLSTVKSLFGLDANARESAAELEASLAVAKDKKANGAFPGAWYWEARVTKLRAQLDAAQALAAEEQLNAQIDQARNLAYTAAAFTGVLILGAIAYNQVQKGRRVQAEIDLLSRSKA